MFSDKNLEFRQNDTQKNEFLSFSKITNTNTRVSFTVHNFKITKIKRGFTFFMKLERSSTHFIIFLEKCFNFS